MDLKEIEAEIRAKHSDFSGAIDDWPSEKEKKLIWQSVCMAYEFGVMKGFTDGFDQHAKIMDFSLAKIFGK